MAQRKIEIKHFNGMESLWNLKLSNNAYDDSIVFAKVWTSVSSCNFIIYAGKDVNGSEYMYEVPTFDDITRIENTIKIDDDGNFTDATFKLALDKYIEDLYNSTDSNTLSNIKKSIEWEEVDGE